MNTNNKVVFLLSIHRCNNYIRCKALITDGESKTRYCHKVIQFYRYDNRQPITNTTSVWRKDVKRYLSILDINNSA